VNLYAADGETKINWGNRVSVASGADLTVNSLMTMSGISNSDNGGGAINNEGNLTFKAGATFTDNSAQYGGAIHNKGTLTFNGTADTLKFDQNKAVNAGGAIYNNGTLAFVGGATFTNNYSTGNNGGAIYNNNYKTLNFSGGTYKFANNTANGNPNDIYNAGEMNIGDSAAETNFYASYITGTGTTNIKGVVNLYAAEGENTIDWGNQIRIADISNELTVSDFITMLNAVQEGGSTIYNVGTLNFKAGATFTENKASSLYDGRVIFNTPRGTVTFDGNTDTSYTFEKNSTTGIDANGGAIYNDGTITFNSKAIFTENKAYSGGAISNSGTLTFNAGAAFSNNSADQFGGAIYNVYSKDEYYEDIGTLNFFGGTYEFANNTASDAPDDIYNAGEMNIGAAGKDTVFNISSVTGGGTDAKNMTNIINGYVRLNSVLSDKTILWHNKINVNDGATLDIGESKLDMMGGSLTVASGGTLQLTITELTAGSLDYTGGQFIMADSSTIDGTLFVNADSVSFNGKTGVLDLLKGYTGALTEEQYSISDGYTISYSGNGGFIIGKKAVDPVTPSRSVEEEKNFITSAKTLALADMRAGVAQISDRLSDLGTAMTALSAVPAADKGRSGGDAFVGNAKVWAKALYTSADMRGSTRMDSDGYGVVAGVDGAVTDDLYLGAALGWTHGKGDTDQSHFKSQTMLGYLYGRYALTQKAGVSGVVGYGFTRFDLSAADNKFNAHTINAQVMADYALPLNLTTEIGGRYTFGTMDSYTTGSVRVASEDTHTATALAGLRYRQNYGKFTVKANVGVLYDVYSDTADYRLTQSGTASYAQGGRLHRFGGEGGVGFGYEDGAFGVETAYSAQVRQDYNDQTVDVKLVYRFK